MKLGRRIAVDATARDTLYFWRAAGTSRFAWNWGKARWDEDFAKAKAETDPAKQKLLWPSAEKLKAAWAEVRRIEFPWSLEVTKCAGTQAIMDLGATYSRAQKERREAKAQGRKPRKMFGFPRFKAKSKVLPSFSLWNDQFSICNHHSAFGRSYATVRIPNLGYVKLREPVPSLGGILGARVTYRRGRWFIAFQYDLDWNDGEQSDKAAALAQSKARKAAIAAGMASDEAKATIRIEAERGERLLPQHPRPHTVGGADLGLIDALVGRVEKAGQPEAAATFAVPNPRRLSKTEKEQRLRRRRERRLSRAIQRARVQTATEAKRAKGDTSPATGADLRSVKHRLSNRQRRLSAVLSKDTWRDTDRRDDFLHKLSDQVARSAEVLVIEDLHVAGMLQNRSLARHLSDAALGRLGTYLAYKAEREGGLALFAPRFFPSSKRCSICGTVKAELDLSLRNWTCEACGADHDRDANAASNLCWLGQLAAAEGMVPAQAKAWEQWIHDARQQVASWRKRKLVRLSEPDQLEDAIESVLPHEVLGAACPEVTRGETVYRGRRKTARGPIAQPRTKKSRKLPARGGLPHIRSPFG